MTAETNGMFIVIFGSSPFLNFTSGVFNDTLFGIHSSVVKFGNNKNCRIPMRKQAIAEVEKADQASA